MTSIITKCEPISVGWIKLRSGVSTGQMVDTRLTALYPPYLLFPCTFLLTIFCNYAYSAPPTENEVKAAFIHNIAKFVEWPAAIPVRGTMRLCILGQPPFTEASALLQGKQIGDMVWEVQPVDSRTRLDECRVLFIAASESSNLSRVLEGIKGSATLTVGDTSGYAAQGVMLNFYPDQGKVRFEINVDAVMRAGLKIGSQLLKLARIVHEPGEMQ